MIERKKSLAQQFYDLPFVQNTIAWSKVYSPIGFSGMTIYEVVIFLNIKADSKEEALFLVELTYGGIFKTALSLSEEDKKSLLFISFFIYWL